MYIIFMLCILSFKLLTLFVIIFLLIIIFLLVGCFIFTVQTFCYESLAFVCYVFTFLRPIFTFCSVFPKNLQITVFMWQLFRFYLGIWQTSEVKGPQKSHDFLCYIIIATWTYMLISVPDHINLWSLIRILSELVLYS